MEGKMMKFKAIAWRISLCVCLIVFVLSQGCAYNVILDPNITPTVNISNRIDLKVGLFISEEMKSFKLSDKADYLTKYTFEIGTSLENIVLKATRSVFSSVEVLQSYPTQQMLVEKQLALFIVSSITSGSISLNVEPGFFSSDAKGSTTLSVQMNFYTHEMVQLASIGASGMGVASEGYVLSTGKKEYSASVERAVRNLGNELVQQMYGNYDVRTFAEQQ